MNKFLFNKKTLYISLALVPLSFVVGLCVVKKWNHFTSLGPYGDFFAGTTVPMLTIASLIAVMMTLNQQQDQLDLQKNEINNNRNKIYQDSLPNRIINIEKSMDILETNIKELTRISQLEIKENPNVTRHQKKIDLFIIKTNFILHPNSQLEKIIKNDLGLIRNNLVYVNTNTYKLFRDFKRELDLTYDSKIKDVEQKLITFQQYIIKKHPIKSLMHDDLNENFIESVFDATDHTEHSKIKSLLHINELSYAREITDKYTKFKKLLEEELITLVNDLS